LWTITRNKAADLARGAQDPCDGRGGSTNMERIQAVADDAWASSSYEASTPAADAAADRKAVVRRAIALIRSSFEPTTWQAFWRTVIDGQSPDEVAEELSLSRWAVYKARSRVLHRLRTELQGLEELD
jgi:RNA polymerase sigma-70 factor (ECF subfamily)